MSGFSHPIVSGSGNLVIPSVQSPNFSIAGGTGWEILQNGLAYFFNVILSGGIITGPDYIINPSGMFFYSGTPATGNLILSITSASGVDGFSNPYEAGFVVGKSSSVQIQMNSNSGLGVLKVLYNNAFITNSSLVGGFGAGYASMVLNGPASTLTGFTDYVYTGYNSSDGSSSANFQLVYVDANSTAHVLFSGSYAGMYIGAAYVAAVVPGTGTSATNPAQQESWHYLATTSGWTNDVIYRLYPDATVGFAGVIGLPVSGTYNGVTICTLPAGYHPIGTKTIAISCDAQSSLYGNNPTFPGTPRVQIATNGAVSFLGLPGSINGSFVNLDGVRFPIDV